MTTLMYTYTYNTLTRISARIRRFRFEFISRGLHRRRRNFFPPEGKKEEGEEKKKKKLLKKRKKGEGKKQGKQRE